MKIKYEGVHAIYFESAGNAKIVNSGDIIEIEQSVFEKDLKNSIHNDRKIWTIVKEKKVNQEV